MYGQITRHTQHARLQTETPSLEMSHDPSAREGKKLEKLSLKSDVNYSWGEERGLFSWPKSTKNQYLKKIMILWESESHTHLREVFSLPLALNHWTMEKWHTDSEKPFAHLFSNPI